MELTLISNHAYSICVAIETLKIMQMRKKENVHMYIYSIRRVKERANDKGRRGCQGKRLWIAFFLCLGTAIFSQALFFTRSRFAGTDNKVTFF